MGGGADGGLEVGASVGRYVLLRPAGGARRARLFVAYDPELDRNVVLKLLSVARGNREQERDRLLREAQAQARLTHPNVVVVYDVGTWSDHVYMAMEYVDGDALDDWLVAAPRRWSEIRDVIVQAGQGLAAAHAAGIVHLNVRPSNIVVASDTLVRVLEFGLARRLRPTTSLESSADGISESGRTAATPVTGAPEYVAAECYRGEELDARADQFALCVTAWEALFGQRPFRGETRDELRADIVRGRVADPPPSEVPTFIEAALRRGLDPNQNKRWPDLPALLRALGRDPGLGRWAKLALGVGGIGVVAGAVAYARAGSTAREVCRGGEQKLVDIWDAPTRRRAHGALRATGVGYAEATWTTVAMGLDEYAQRWLQMYADACAATRLRGEQSEALLDRRMACLEDRRMELRASVNVLLDADAGVAKRAVVATRGLSPLEGCADVDMLMARPIPATPTDAEHVTRLRELLAQAHALQRAGRVRTTATVAQQALSLAIDLESPEHEARARLVLSTVADGGGDVDAAIEEVNLAIWAADRAGADGTRVDAYTQAAWTVGHRKAEYERGHQLVAMGLALADRLGDDAMPRARLLAAEAVLFFDEGRYRDAIALQHRVDALITQTGSPQPELAATLNNLAAAHQLLGEHEQALTYYDRARRTRTQLLGATHPEVAEVTANAASVKHTIGLLDEAEADFREALAILDAQPEGPLAAVPNLHNNFASLLQEQGAYDEALQYYQRSLESWRRADPEQPLVGMGLCNVADLEISRGRPAEAERLAREGLALLERRLDPSHHHLGWAASTLGRALLAGRKPNEALPPLRRGIAILAGVGADSHAIAQTQLALARAIAATGGDRDEARTLAVSASRRFADLSREHARADATAFANGL